MTNKKFVITYSQGLSLLNKEETEEYMERKYQHFRQFKNYSDKEELLGFFQEILNMIDFDIKSAEIDTSSITNKKGFDYDRENIIRWYDIAHIMGSVFLSVFDEGDNRLRRVTDGKNGAIRTSEMIMCAYQELSKHKLMKINNGSSEPAYGATLIFVTLFERELKLRTRLIYSKKFLLELKKRMDSSKITLTEDEMDLFKYLSYSFGISHSKSTNFYDANAALKLQYEMFKKYNIIESKDEKIRAILCEESTLNDLLNNKYFKKITDIRFYKIVSIIFGTKKLNLRNNLAHCNFERMNYYRLSVTALLYILLHIVLEEYYLKNEI